VAIVQFLPFVVDGATASDNNQLIPIRAGRDETAQRMINKIQNVIAELAPIQMDANSAPI
jgi:hypothetical protein